MIDFNQIDKKIYSLGNKRYFSIKEVSDFCAEKDSVLRYWESEFRQLKPQKVQNQRRYRQKDIRIILIIHTLLRDKGMSIEQGKKYLLNPKLLNNYQASNPQQKTIQTLGNIKPQNLKDIQDKLKKILIGL